MLSDFLNRPVDNPVAFHLIILIVMSVVALLDWWGRRRDHRSSGPRV